MTEIGKMVLNTISDNSFNNRILENIAALKEYCSNVCLNTFRWETDEKEDTLFFSSFSIETALLWQNVVGCVNTDFGTYIVPCNVRQFNLISEPTVIQPLLNTVSGTSGNNEILNSILNKEFYEGEFVVGWNTFSRYKMLPYLENVIEDLAIILAVLQQLTQTLRQPFIVNTTDKKLYNDKFLMNDILNQDVIYTEEFDNINVLNLNVDVSRIETLENLRKERFRTLNGLLGVSYESDLKKERLIVSEVETREEVKEMFSQSKLQSRFDFCNKVKQFTNKNLYVTHVLTGLTNKPNAETKEESEERGISYE